jgi:hypothetical protein
VAVNGLLGTARQTNRWQRAQLDTSAIATRYDKLAKTFLAGVQLACATILLK